MLFRSCRGGREGASSGADLLLCFSGRLWWRGEEPVVVCGPFLVVWLVVFFFSGVSALAGLGGEGSGVCRSMGGAVGGPGRRCVGRELGGAEELVL